MVPSTQSGTSPQHSKELTVAHNENPNETKFVSELFNSACLLYGLRVGLHPVRAEVPKLNLAGIATQAQRTITRAQPKTSRAATQSPAQMKAAALTEARSKSLNTAMFISFVEVGRAVRYWLEPPANGGSLAMVNHK